MNILYICGGDPDEVGCGTKVRTHFLYEALKSVGTVYVFNPPVDRRPGLAAYLFRGFTKVGRLPCMSAKAARAAVGFEGVEFDLVVVRYMSLAAEYCAWKIAPCYIDIDDVPVQAFRIDRHRVPFGLRWLAALTVRIWQRYVLGKCRGAWVVKEEDRKHVPRGVRLAVLRNLAAGPATLDYGVKRERMLMSVGLMAYGPNSEGVAWFIREVWPKFHADHPDWRYVVAGRGTPEWLVRECERIGGVDVLGFVDDLDALYAKSTAVVAPILSGAGSCVKVSESALHGRKTFVTACAARGLSSDEIAGMGLEVFASGDDFLQKLDCWASLSPVERSDRERRIFENARRVNSFDAFAKTVRQVLTES